MQNTTISGRKPPFQKMMLKCTHCVMLGLSGIFKLTTLAVTLRTLMIQKPHKRVQDQITLCSYKPCIHHVMCTS